MLPAKQRTNKEHTESNAPYMATAFFYCFW